MRIFVALVILSGAETVYQWVRADGLESATEDASMIEDVDRDDAQAPGWVQRAAGHAVDLAKKGREYFQLQCLDKDLYHILLEMEAFVASVHLLTKVEVGAEEQKSATYLMRELLLSKKEFLEGCKNQIAHELKTAKDNNANFFKTEEDVFTANEAKRQEEFDNELAAAKEEFEKMAARYRSKGFQNHTHDYFDSDVDVEGKIKAKKAEMGLGDEDLAGRRQQFNEEIEAKKENFRRQAEARKDRADEDAVKIINENNKGNQGVKAAIWGNRFDGQVVDNGGDAMCHCPCVDKWADRSGPVSAADAAAGPDPIVDSPNPVLEPAPDSDQ